MALAMPVRIMATLGFNYLRENAVEGWGLTPQMMRWLFLQGYYDDS